MNDDIYFRSANFALATVGGILLFIVVPGFVLALLCSGCWAFFWGWILRQ